jgi:translation initiation factor 1A
MPNQKGGKNYKKSKHVSAGFKPIMIDRQPDQMYGRIIRNLGQCRLLVYCNDNRTRMCHIRGAMRKKVWLGLGDMVLISKREFEKKPAVGTEELENGDIVAKYDADLLSTLRKLPDINKRLFMRLETMDGKVLEEIGRKNENELPDPDDEENDDGITFDDDAEEGAEKKEDEEKEIDIDDI